MLVSRKPTVKQGGGYVVVVPVVGLPSPAPGVVAQAFNKVARGIADGGDTAEMVIMGIVHGFSSALLYHNGKQTGWALQIVQLAH